VTFVEVWIGYSVIGVLVFSSVFLWAVRARQFSDLDRAGHIPLRSPDDTERSGLIPSRLDRFSLLGLALIVASALIAVLWIGMRG
jgi:cbb3-type cytochrome oxidase maturation protein